MCGEAYVRDTFLHHGDADAAVIEGVMGLYDGAQARQPWQACFPLPVVLVIDALRHGGERSALIRGMRQWGRGPGSAST